jgi:hypothetical protein
MKSIYYSRLSAKIKVVIIFFAAVLTIFLQSCDRNPVSPTTPQNNRIETAIGEQMIVEATLAAHLVAIAEQVGLSTAEINSHLKAITDNSIINEFWITDERGHAYLTNTGIDFAFSPDSTKQPQAFVFWSLLTGRSRVVNQGVMKREIDNKQFKYVAVSGIDKRRIVQVGINAGNLFTTTDLENLVGQHMAAEATIAAHLVAIAEKAGLSTAEINNHLMAISSSTVLDEFWITDSTGHAYLTNTGLDFTFSPDSTKQPQAYVFWKLINGTAKVIIQNAQKREIDNEIFKYVGVAGIDKPRIVQVGIHYMYFN